MSSRRSPARSGASPSHWRTSDRPRTSSMPSSLGHDGPTNSSPLPREPIAHETLPRGLVTPPRPPSLAPLHPFAGASTSRSPRTFGVFVSLRGPVTSLAIPTRSAGGSLCACVETLASACAKCVSSAAAAL
eukprot:6189869-Pleurochrysis_carterae.AAC.2